MSISFSVYPYNLMHRWQERMNESPWRFNQMEGPTHFGHTTGGTRDVYLQHHRRAVAEALHSAYVMITRLIGYYPKPTWTVDKVVQFEPYLTSSTQPTKNQSPFTRFDAFTPLDIASSFGIPNKAVTSFTPEVSPSIGTTTGRVLQIGKPKSTLIEAGVSLTDVTDDDGTLDFDGDMQYDWKQAVVSEYGRTDSPSEIILRHPSIDNINVPGDPSQLQTPWQYYRYASDADDTDVNIYFRTPYLVKPELFYQRYNTDIGARSDENIIGYSDDSFIQSIDIYKDDIEDENRGYILSEVRDGDNPGIFETEVHVNIIDAQNGRVSVRKIDDIDLPDGAIPFALKVSYQSGFPLDGNGNMNFYLETAIIELANTMLKDKKIPCSDLATKLFESSTASLLSSGIFGEHIPVQFINPLGGLLGHYRAWTICKIMADDSLGQLRKRADAWAQPGAGQLAI